jgi:RNA polymerase sigma factor (sigma-70 family)
MSEETSLAMSDARDAEDARLLANGEYTQVVENYYGVVIDRCKARIPARDALDVAANVIVRLLDELQRGLNYSVPFRVVVHKVTSWKIAEYYEPAKFKNVEFDELIADHAQREGDDVGSRAFRERETELDFLPDLDRLLDGLPTRGHEVAVLRIRDDLTPEEIGARLGIDRNAVDQAWNRAKKVLRERVSP